MVFFNNANLNDISSDPRKYLVPETLEQPGCMRHFFRQLRAQPLEWHEARPEFVATALSLATDCIGPDDQVAAILFISTLKVRRFSSLTPYVLNTLLCEALVKNNTVFILALIDEGASPNSSDNRFRKTPLQIACELGNEVAALQLLKRGADPMLTSSPSQDTPLHLACRKGFSSAVLQMLEGKWDLECRNAAGETPLHCAVQAGDINLVLALLRKGACVDALDGKGETPLMYCARTKQLSLQFALMGYGADPARISPTGYRMLDRDLDAAARQIIYTNSPSALPRLLENGLDPHSPDLYGYSPAAIALITGNCVRLFDPNIFEDPSTKLLTAVKEMSNCLNLQEDFLLGTKRYQMQGSYPEQFYRLCLNVVESNALSSRILSETQKNELRDALSLVSQGPSIEELLRSIRSGRLTLFSTGWTTHHIGVVVKKVGELWYLGLTNRSIPVGDRESSLRVMRIDPSKLTRELLKTIVDFRLLERDPRVVSKFLYETLPQLLSPGPEKDAEITAFCIRIQTIGLGKQLGKNCTWASTIASIRLSLAFFALENGSSPYWIEQRKLDRVCQLSKEFSLHAKVITYIRFKETYAQMPPALQSPELMEQVEARMSAILTKRRTTLETCLTTLHKQPKKRKAEPITSSYDLRPRKKRMETLE